MLPASPVSLVAFSLLLRILSHSPCGLIPAPCAFSVRAPGANLGLEGAVKAPAAVAR